MQLRQVNGVLDLLKILVTKKHKEVTIVNNAFQPWQFHQLNHWLFLQWLTRIFDFVELIVDVFLQV
jgi:50S ribosomal subunit-associated GTPase HflX